MASNRTALFLALNLLLFALGASGCDSTGATGCHMHTAAGASSQKEEMGNKQCSLNTLKLGVCAAVLDRLIHINLGMPPKEPCCGLVHGLVDLDAAVCVCAALKANILGIHLNLPLSLNLLLNFCGKQVPDGFQCPS